MPPRPTLARATLDPGRPSGSLEIRCLRCSRYLGESAEPLEVVGVVKESALREAITRPRATWRCGCGWMTVYRLSAVSGV